MDNNDARPDIAQWLIQSQRRLKLWENEFFPQWLELTTYQTTGEEFNPDAHASFNRGASPWARRYKFT